MTILKDGIEYIIGAATIIGFIWKIAEVKNDLLTKIGESRHGLNNKIQEIEGRRTEQIDKLEDALNDKFNQLDKRLDLFIVTSTNALTSLEQRHEGATRRLGEQLEKTQKRISGAIVFERLEGKVDEFLKRE